MTDIINDHVHLKHVGLNRAAGMRMAILGLWLILLVVAILAIGPDNILANYSKVTPQSIRDQVSAFGDWAVVAFLCASLLRQFTFIPVTPFTMASGFLFGFWQGILWSTAGTTLSAALSFLLSRYLFRDFIVRALPERYRHIDRSLKESGWRYVLFARLIPFVPFDFLGYAVGISGIGFRDYMIGTIAGELPGACVLVLLGSSLDRIGSTVFYFSLLLALAVLFAPEIIRRYARVKREKTQQ